MPQVAPTAKPASLELSFDAVRTSNPFLSNRVNEPSVKDVDVPGIHRVDSETLVQLAQSVVRDRSAIGVMLLGGAGVGKSHLLSRFWRWAKDNDAYYLFLHNILASAERIPRHFLRYAMSMLARSSDANRESELYTLLHRFVKVALKKAGLGCQTSISECRRAFVQLADDFQTVDGGIRDVVLDMLFAYFRLVNTGSERNSRDGDLASAVVAWLSGDAIDPEVAQQAGVKLNAAFEDDDGACRLCDNQHIEEVVLVLTELAAAVGRPFIVCIDQVDNLDDVQVRSLARFLHALLDHARNLLVVTSGVKESILEFKDTGVIPEASWDRLASRKIDLYRVPIESARQILCARLQPIQQRFQQVPELKKLLDAHELFPLSSKQFEHTFGESVEIRPRDVINWAREQWDHERAELQRKGGPKWLAEWPISDDVTPPPPPPPPVDLEKRIDERVQSKIREAVAQRREHKGSLPPDADNLATLVESLLGCCLSRVEQYSLRGLSRLEGERPPFHLRVREIPKGSSQEVVNGVAFVTTRDGRTSTGALRRLLRAEGPLDHRILVTDEERAPLPMPERGKEFYNELLGLGDGAFHHVKLDFQQYAELDALHGVIAQARVGDLEIELGGGRSRWVSEDEVIQSLHRLDVFRRHPLLGELTQEPPVEDRPKAVKLSEKDVRETVMGNLSWNICMSTNELTQTYLEMRSDIKIGFDDAHNQIMQFSQRMAEENLIAAKPHDGALLLMLASP